MLIVAGLSLKNLRPRVWDLTSEYFLPRLEAVMVSYADLHAMPARRQKAMEQGFHDYLGAPRSTKVYLDNGAFCFLKGGGAAPVDKYREFVQEAKPDWYPVPQDFIPAPAMSAREQRRCFKKTMAANESFHHDGFVPVIHVGRMLSEYIDALSSDETLSAKPAIAVGGIVPHLLRRRKAMPYEEVLANLRQARESFPAKDLHVFGVGGNATIHLAALMGFDSVDSSGWRNRAARGIIQLPGTGDRMIANLGSWRGRRPSRKELQLLKRCRCPACRKHGVKGLRASGQEGFCNRASHNLWVLLEEADWVAQRLRAGTYARCYRRRLDNTIYLPLIEQMLENGPAQETISSRQKQERARQ